MGNRKTRSQLRSNLQPLSVLKTALVALLNQHRDSGFFPDYSFLMGCLRASQWNKLLEWSKENDSPIPPDHTVYGTPEFEMYLVRREFVALFRKFAFEPKESGLDPEAAALKSFRASERRCELMNRKLRLLLNTSGSGNQARPHPEGKHDPLYFLGKECVGRSRIELYQFLDSARRWIKSVIGSNPNLPSIYMRCDFGGGASVGVHGKATNIGRKLLADSWTVTPACIPFACSALMANYHLRSVICPVGGDNDLVSDETYYWTIRSKMRVIQHNKLEFVPKTAMTHRVIATEPLLNGFVQKGIDVELRDLLRKAGIDLKYGWKFNQIWARAGSHERTDGFATLDLSSASDSICIALAKFLLPPGWFSLLNSVRAPSYEHEGLQKRSEKFCSMGNGFCFPLETLIFAAFAATAAVKVGQRPRFLVYGDDIIVKQSVVPLLVKRLYEVGFRLNQHKSYWEGPFRESCGADWVHGREVTPVYMRKRISSVQQLIDFHNSLQTKCFGEPFRFPIVTEALRSLVPIDDRPLELFRPGTKPFNTGFVVELDEFMASPLTRWMPDERCWVSKEIKTSALPDDLLVGHPLQNVVEYISVLRGSSSEQPLTVRRETKTRYGYYDHSARDMKSMIASRRYLPLQP